MTRAGAKTRARRREGQRYKYYSPNKWRCGTARDPSQFAPPAGTNLALYSYRSNRGSSDRHMHEYEYK